MKEKQSRDSIFVGLPGLLTLLFLAVAAVYFRAGLVAAFLCFLSFLCVLSRFWSRAVLRRVDVSVDAIQSSCHAGETLQLKLQVRNRSFLPLVWLDVILPTGQKPLMRSAGAKDFSWFFLRGEAYAQTGIRERFVWLLWQQEIFWEETLLAVRRGVVELTGLGLQAGDGFGLSARDQWKELLVPLRLIIYPKLIPVTVQPFLKITQEAVAASKGQTEDITILKSSRPYEPGDPMKRINWRLLAGSGRMEVNVYEKVMPGCAAFLLDLESFRRIVERKDGQGNTELVKEFCEKELEEMISLAASCMCAIAESGILTALVIPAYGEQEMVFCIPGSDEDVLRRSMEALAMVQYQGEDTSFSYDEFWRISHKLGNLYICARTEKSSGMAELAYHLGRSRVRYLILGKEKSGAGEFDCLYAENIALARFQPDGEEAAGNA